MRENNRKKGKDNIIYVDGPQEAREANERAAVERKKQKNSRSLLLIGAALAAILVVYLFANRQFRGYKVLSNTETNYENMASYVEYGGNMLKYTPDGVSYINSNGDTVWTAGIDMKMPVAVTSGDYAAVADLNGNSICVFGLEGQISNLTMPYNICDVDIANQGAFVVVLESNQTNYVNLYNKKGEIVYEIQTTIDKSGYPLDVTISDDGEKLFTSYIGVGSSRVSNNLAAYNFGDVGQNANADRIVGGYMFDDQIFPKLEFVNNDTVVAFGTKDIKIYSMKEKPSEKGSIEAENEIRSVFYAEDFIGTICDTGEEEEKTLYSLVVYDLHGKKKFDKSIDFKYNNVYAFNDEIIVTGENRCMIIRSNGRTKFDGQLEGRVSSVVPSGKGNEYVVVYDNATQIIKLRYEAASSVKSDASEEETQDNSAEE